MKSLIKLLLQSYNAISLSAFSCLQIASRSQKALGSYKRLAIFLTAVIVVIISACHSEPLRSKQITQHPLTTCRVIQHMMGETCVPNHPKRVVTLYTPALTSALALGVRPIAITPVTGAVDIFPLYLKDKVEDIEIVATTEDIVNLEKILQLKPDLILGWDHHDAIYSLLSQISSTLLPQKNRVKSSREDWKEYLNFLAEALKKQDIAQQILSHYKQRIKELRTALDDRYESKKISVAYVSQDYGTKAQTKNSFSGSILDDLGLQRPELQNTIQPGGMTTEISTEQLEQIDGDILFVLTFGETDKKMLEKLEQNSLWKTLKAVQRGQVYLVDGWTWVVGNPLAADAVLDDLYKYLLNTP